MSSWSTSGGDRGILSAVFDTATRSQTIRRSQHFSIPPNSTHAIWFESHPPSNRKRVFVQGSGVSETATDAMTATRFVKKKKTPTLCPFLLAEVCETDHLFIAIHGQMDPKGPTAFVLVQRQLLTEATARESLASQLFPNTRLSMGANRSPSATCRLRAFGFRSKWSLGASGN